MAKVLRHKGWRILAVGSTPEASKVLFEQEISGQLPVARVLCDNQRSRVLRVQASGQDLVVKYPIEKNQGKWIRLTTWFRMGEAFKTIKGMVKLHQMGVPSTKPLFAAEKRRFGMVVDSLMAYQYLEGAACETKDHPQVVASLKAMHQRGIVHGDPQIRNFVRTPQGHINIIDSKPAKNLLGKVGEAYELVYLAKSAPGIESHIPDRHHWLYKAAKAYDRFDRGMARWRRAIRTLAKR